MRWSGNGLFYQLGTQYSNLHFLQKENERRGKLQARTIDHSTANLGVWESNIGLLQIICTNYILSFYRIKCSEKYNKRKSNGGIKNKYIKNQRK